MRAILRILCSLALLLTVSTAWASGPFVAVIGGGPSGLMTTLEAYFAGARVTLVRDRTVYTREQTVNLDERSVAQLQRILGTSAFEKLVELGYAAHDAKSDRVVISIMDLEKVLFAKIEALKAQSGGALIVLDDQRFHSFGNNEINIEDKRGNFRTLRPDFVIGADSAESTVAKALGIQYIEEERPRLWVGGVLPVNGRQLRLASKLTAAGKTVYNFGTRFKQSIGFEVDETIFRKFEGASKAEKELEFRRLLAEGLKGPGGEGMSPESTRTLVHSMAISQVGEFVSAPEYAQVAAARVPFTSKMIAFLAGDSARTTDPRFGEGANRGFAQAWAIGLGIRAWSSGVVRSADQLIDEYNRAHHAGVLASRKRAQRASFGSPLGRKPPEASHSGPKPADPMSHKRF